MKIIIDSVFPFGRHSVPLCLPLRVPPLSAGGEGSVHLGLTSGYLKELRAGDTVELFSNRYVIENGNVLRGSELMNERMDWQREQGRGMIGRIDKQMLKKSLWE